MTEMFGEAWSPMSVPDLAPDDDDDEILSHRPKRKTNQKLKKKVDPSGIRTADLPYCRRIV